MRVFLIFLLCVSSLPLAAQTVNASDDPALEQESEEGPDLLPTSDSQESNVSNLLSAEADAAAADTESGFSVPTGQTEDEAQPVRVLGEGSDAERSQERTAAFLTDTGAAYVDEGEFEAAERAYLRALEMDPENDETLGRLALLYVSMERFGDAADLFSRRLEKDPLDPLANNNLAWCYIVGPEIRNIPLALRHVREALLTEPRLFSAWNTLAEAYYVSGDYDRAQRAAELALDLMLTVEAAPEDIEKFQLQIQRIERVRALSEMMDD